MKKLAAVLLLGACLGAQSLPKKKLLWAALAGATAGALVGARGLSFAAVPAGQVGARRWRAGLTFGVLGGVLAAAGAAALTPSSAPAPHRFWWDRANTPLIFGIATVQALDFSSTHYFRNRGKDEWLLTNQLVDNRPAFATTEIAATAAGVGLMYLLHRSGHHRLERWAAAGWIAVGILSAVANYRYPTTGHALF
ncbi:MAG TPA: hypothetical protein VMV31_04270 [Terriglobales bacterium]|nr:hypothetical protein [Terriglobales bacterium]